jgi:pectate lyase
LIGTGLAIKNAKNIIIQNLKISKVQKGEGDAIGIQKATNIWIDHCDLSSDMNHGKDFYDGLLDITHAGDFITVSNTRFHDHFKASLVGHSDNNGAEDRGKLRVTYHNNYWYNINSRAPSLRFGTGHIYNSLFENVGTGINTRQRAQVLAENNVFVNCTKPLYSTDGGFAIQRNNDFGNGANAALAGTLSSPPYRAILLSASEVRALAKSAGVVRNA